MIRQALIALGLSAGAAHGQGLVPTAPLLETCGGTRLVLEAEGDPDRAALEQARSVISARVGSMFTTMFDYADVQDDQIIVSLPATMGDASVLDPLLRQVGFGFYAVVAETTSPDGAAEGQIILPDSRDETLFFILNDQPLLDSTAITRAYPVVGQGGEPAVDIEFSDTAGRFFAQWSAGNVGSQMAAVLDGEVLTGPRILAALNDRFASVSGGFTMEDSAALAAILQGGALPFDLVVKARQTLDGSDPSADFCP